MIHLFSHYVPARVVLLAALEGLLFLIASVAGIYVYLHIPASGAVSYDTANELFSQSGLFVGSMLVILASMGLYQPDLWMNKRSVVLRIAVSFGLAYALVKFFSHVELLPSPGPLTTASALALVLVGSVALRAAINEWSGSPAFRSRVLVLGTGSRAVKIEENAQHNPQHEIVGYLSLKPATHFVPQTRILHLREGETLASMVKRNAIDKVVIAVRDRRGGALPIDQLLECRARGVKVTEMASFFESQYRQVLLESVSPSWMVLASGFRSDPLSNLLKRAFDLGASLMLLFLTWPIMLITAFCIRIESGGPVLYRQERVGKDEHVFQLLKFRSMRTDAESDGNPQWASENDARVTKVGRFIRKVRIDELPQVFNVIRGDMSFVGPRPERPFFVSQLTGQIPYYAMRHSVRPGITGWAQVRYSYGATIDDAVEKLQFDLYYVKNRSLFLDMMILISTVEVVLWGKGAR